jgi:hypothetical protein
MSISPSSSWKRLAGFWGVAIVVLAILIAVKVKQNIERGRAPALQQQAYLVRERASNAFYRNLHYVLKANMTRADVEAVANGGKPIWTHPFLAEDADGGKPEWLEVGYIRDPATGGEVEIAFPRNRDAWRGYGPVVRNPPQEPPLTAAWALGEEIRGRIDDLAPARLVAIAARLAVRWPLRQADIDGTTAIGGSASSGWLRSICTRTNLCPATSRSIGGSAGSWSRRSSGRLRRSSLR